MAETNKERLLAVEQAWQLGKIISKEEEAIIVLKELYILETDTSNKLGAKEA